jgi:hypothetical protein
MNMLNSLNFVALAAPLRCLLWLGLFMVLGILVPFFLTRAWNQQHGLEVQSHPKQLFQRGELGLVGLWLAIAAIWNLQTSFFVPDVVALGSVMLAFAGIMAGSVWIESHCRQAAGMALNPQRAWRDSRNMLLLVLSMAAVTEILLDRYAKVVAQ